MFLENITDWYQFLIKRSQEEFEDTKGVIKFIIEQKLFSDNITR